MDEETAQKFVSKIYELTNELLQLSCKLQSEIAKSNSTSKCDKIEYDDNDLISISEARELTGLSTSYLYRISSEKRVPVYKSGKKNVFFNKKELLNYVKGTPPVLQ